MTELLWKLWERSDSRWLKVIWKTATMLLGGSKSMTWVQKNKVIKNEWRSWQPQHGYSKQRIKPVRRCLHLVAGLHLVQRCSAWVQWSLRKVKRGLHDHRKDPLSIQSRSSSQRRMNSPNLKCRPRTISLSWFASSLTRFEPQIHNGCNSIHPDLAQLPTRLMPLSGGLQWPFHWANKRNINFYKSIPLASEPNCLWLGSMLSSKNGGFRHEGSY